MTIKFCERSLENLKLVTVYLSKRKRDDKQIVVRLSQNGIKAEVISKNLDISESRFWQIIREMRRGE